jgi:hypothetical protein
MAIIKHDYKIHNTAHIHAPLLGGGGDVLNTKGKTATNSGNIFHK